MRGIVRIAIVGVWLVAGVGCASGVRSGGRQVEWVGRHGGVVAEGRQERAERALGMIRGVAGRGVSVRVLGERSVCAYGWPDGELFVTKGLVDLVDDRELAAALAHELGHLMADGRGRGAVSLAGCERCGDAEERADAIGVRVLEAAGLGGGEMVLMLEKVEGARGVSARAREGIARRVAVLKGRGAGSMTKSQ